MDKEYEKKSFISKYRIFPNSLQYEFIEQHLGNVRFIQNQLITLTLEDPKQRYQYIGKKK